MNDFALTWQTPSYGLTVLVRTTGDTLPLAAEMRRQVSIVDKELPISNFRAMDEVVGRSLGPRRFSVVLLTVFTGLAIILACVGVYGLMAYTVTQRTREFGIRLALGPQRNAILWLVIAQSLRIVLPGVFAGMLAAFALSRFLQSLLYEVATTDPGVFGLLPAALALVALAAAVIPAVRALRLNPVTSLRAE